MRTSKIFAFALATVSHAGGGIAVARYEIQHRPDRLGLGSI